MTLAQIKAKATSSEDYNSTNGWGFGGWVGKILHFPNGCKMYTGKWYYRHTSPSKVESYWNADGNEVTKAEFEKLIGDGH